MESHVQFTGRNFQILHNLCRCTVCMSVEDTHSTGILICSLAYLKKQKQKKTKTTPKFKNSLWKDAESFLTYRFYYNLHMKCYLPISAECVVPGIQRKVQDASEQTVTQSLCNKRMLCFNSQWLIAGSGPETWRSCILYCFYANVAVSDLDNPIIVGNGGLGNLMHQKKTWNTSNRNTAWGHLNGFA